MFSARFRLVPLLVLVLTFGTVVTAVSPCTHHVLNEDAVCPGCNITLDCDKRASMSQCEGTPPGNDISQMPGPYACLPVAGSNKNCVAVKDEEGWGVEQVCCSEMACFWDFDAIPEQCKISFLVNETPRAVHKTVDCPGRER